MASSDTPDGSWLDNPRTVKSVLMFLIGKLSPADAEELDAQLTGEGTATAMDARLDRAPDLRRDWLKYSPRDRRVLRNSLAGAPGMPMTVDQIRRADPDYGKSLEERFPNINRLRGNGGL